MAVQIIQAVKTIINAITIYDTPANVMDNQATV